jgi:hypothetical protein
MTAGAKAFMCCDSTFDVTHSLQPHAHVMTLILNEYQQSSNSSVLAFKFKVQRQLRMPIARYCLSVELV